MAIHPDNPGGISKKPTVKPKPRGTNNKPATLPNQAAAAAKKAVAKPKTRGKR